MRGPYATLSKLTQINIIFYMIICQKHGPCTRGLATGPRRENGGFWRENVGF